MASKKEGVGFLYLALFAIIAYVAFLVVEPFLTAMVIGAIVAYTFYPVQKRLVTFVKSPTVSAVLVSFLILALLVVPAVFIVQTATTEARVAYITAKQRLVSQNPLGIECAFPSEFVCKATDQVRELLKTAEVKQYLQDVLGKAVTLIVQKTSAILLGLPRLLLSAAVSFFVIFFCLRDGDSLVRKLKGYIPLAARHQDHIVSRIKETVYAVVYGSIVVALIQGALGGLGFFVVGISNPLFWGLVMAVLALVPFGGTALIWAPAGIFLAIDGYGTLNYVQMWSGIGLLLYGMFVVGTIDNLLKPKIIGERTGLHPVLVFVGALGGIALFGPVGFVLGPLVVALFHSMVEIYKQERTHA